jgi:hypothetical protein
MRIYTSILILSGLILGVACRETKVIEPETIPEVPNPYLGKWENVEYKVFKYYSLENGISSNKIDSSVLGKYDFEYQVISNTSIEFNYGDTQKLVQPFTIVNDKTISIKPIFGAAKEYSVLKVDNQNLLLESFDPSFNNGSTTYSAKRRELWKKKP